VSSLGKTGAFAAVLAAMLPLGCSLLLDSSTRQCSSDHECAVVNAVCDQRGGVCVPVPAVVTVTTSIAVPSNDAGVTGLDTHAERDAGDSGAAASLSPCSRIDKPVERLASDFVSSFRLGCERDYLLVGSIAVKAGAVLTIDPGTQILGDVTTKGRLVVERGARLVADGQRMAPIVFTSAAPPAMRRAGDWGGVVLLGRAPSAEIAVESVGLRPGDGFGGPDDQDDGGVLRFARIEYAGASSATSGAGAALSLAGVGRGTQIENVQVRQSAQDCFKFIGGSVGAKHLVCQGSPRDGFAFQGGFHGKLQFLVVQQSRYALDGSNGLSVRNVAFAAAAPPVTEPTIYNVTLYGRSVDVAGEQYGIVVAGGARAHISNALLAGFEAGIDVRSASSVLDLRNSLFGVPIAYAEDGSNTTNQFDDDGGLDESKLFGEPDRKNVIGRPPLPDGFDANRIGLAPALALRTDAGKPPIDGFFDADAAYLGALRDSTDGWLQGDWLQWKDR
jgi:hypothetical protein